MDLTLTNGHVDRMQVLAGEVKELAKHVHKPALTRSELSQLLPKLPLLVELARTPDEDPRTTLTAIQARVREAVDRLTDGSGEVARPSEEEIAQIGHLLGLAPETRGTVWGQRQKAAAKVMNHSVSTFRREPQERLLHLVALELARGARGSTAQSRVGAFAELKAFSGQTDARPWLVNYIRTERPQEARLVLASGAASVDVLVALREAGADVTLLLRHPDFALTESQQERVEASIKEIRQIWFAGYRKRLRIFLYRAPAGIRGWCVGDLVGLSWYTYRDDHDRNPDHPDQTVLSGHDNLVIVGNARTPTGAQLRTWFDREITCLLENRRTITEVEFYDQRRKSDLPQSKRRGRRQQSGP